MTKMIDLTGQKFDRLTVKGRSDNSDRGQARWECVCDCGEQVTVTGVSLRNRNTKSCGCLRKDLVRSLRIINRKHGMFGTRIYDMWAGMHKRCRGTSGIEQKRRYHDRGIRVCKEWREFIPFMKWALANGYNEHLTIDRKDNDGPYSPANCRFSSATRQANNRSSNRNITFHGETKTSREWERNLGLPVGMIADRLRRGWSPREAITTPRATPRRRIA